MCIFPTHVCCDDLFSIYPSERLHSLLSSMKELHIPQCCSFYSFPARINAKEAAIKVVKSPPFSCNPASMPGRAAVLHLSPVQQNVHTRARLIQRCVFCCSICLNSQTSSCIHRSSTLLQCMVYRSWVHRLFPT